MEHLPGFLPFGRGTFMMDLVATAMVAIIPLLTLSLWMVRSKKRYKNHKQIQLGMAMVLLVTVIGFELHVRIYGWQDQAKPSPYFDTILFPLLYIHLFFAIGAVLLWAITIYGALKGFKHSVAPGVYSHRHKQLGRSAALFMYMTSITGWIFYYLGFVAV